MLDLSWAGRLGGGRQGRGASRPRVDQKPRLETLEGRQLLVASIGSIPNVSVPQAMGYQVPIDGSGASGNQTFTVTSSNPNIKAAVAVGPFFTINVSHTPASGFPDDPTINNQPITFQLFEDLTPITANNIASFTESGYYNGKTIHRIVSNFDNQPNGYVIQGGAPNPDGSGSSGLPGTPFGIEPVQQLAYVQPGSIAMARAQSFDSNDTQFFFTTGTPTSLDYLYTIFGQVVSGQSTIEQLTEVATTSGSLPGENSRPISPVVINTATITQANPNGVIHIDATGATAGQTATITVTATEAGTGTQAVQTFQVSVNPNTIPPPASFTFKPLAFPVSVTAGSNTPTAVQLAGTTQNPNNPAVRVEYAIASQPANGTITGFDPVTGRLNYTANAGFSGTDTFTYSVTNVGGSPTPLAGNTNTVTVNVTAEPPAPPVDTGTVRVVNNVLLVTPRPRTDRGTNNILVGQALDPTSPANDRLFVSINGETDLVTPLASAIDRIVVYGAKANDNIAVQDEVDATLNVTLDGGQGGRNWLSAAAGPTRMHGWFGSNTLIGGTGRNQMVGAAGRVRFRPTDSTSQIFAGIPMTPGGKQNLPEGTFYRYVNGKIVPVTHYQAGTRGLAQPRNLPHHRGT